MALLTVLGFGWQADAWSATYYVDPTVGSDANGGTVQTAPWKSVPGMSGASSWGAVTSGNKVAAGSVIDVKAGSAFTGKRWLIDTTYYATGTATARTTIRVSPTWGTGNVVVDGTGVSVPQYNGGVQISSGINYLTITGADATKRIEIRKYSGHAGILWYQSPSGRAKFNEFKWFEVHHNSDAGFGNDAQDNMLVQDGLSHDNTTGFLIGDASDAGGSNDVYRRLTGYNNGVGAQQNDGSLSIGFQQTGSVNALFDTCEAYGNGRDGFDGGRADNAGDSSVTFLNSSSHDNGEDGFGLNSGQTGNVVAKHINTIAARNKQANWTTYDGAHLEIYNSVGIGSPYNFHAFASYAGWPVPTHKIRNSYFRVLSGARQIHYYNQQAAGYPTFDSDYNIWAPNTSNSEAWDDDGTGKTYTAPPTWKGAHDKIGIANVQAFVNTATDDYHLASSGPANNAGISIATPSEALTDRGGFVRANPPDIGLYEFGGGSVALLPPANLRVVP